MKPLINLYFVYNCAGIWNQALLLDLLDGKLGELPFDVKITENQEDLKGGGILVYPCEWSSRRDKEEVDCIHNLISEMPWALVLHVGDEWGEFDSSFLRRDKVKVWMQTNNPEKPISVDRNILFSYSHNTRELIQNVKKTDKEYLWSFVGQNTHSKREDCVNELIQRPDGEGYLYPTKGFTQGLPRDYYFEVMCKSKIIICPSGPSTPDTFRLYEALEGGCLPICNSSSPNLNPDINYWKFVLDYKPIFPTVNKWSDVHILLDFWKNNPDKLEEKIEAVQDWWFCYKSNMRTNLINDIGEISG